MSNQGDRWRAALAGGIIGLLCLTLAARAAFWCWAVCTGRAVVVLHMGS
jgi:nicotinamide riboside transporter PnuC